MNFVKSLKTPNPRFGVVRVCSKSNYISSKKQYSINNIKWKLFLSFKLDLKTDASLDF